MRAREPSTRWCGVCDESALPGPLRDGAQRLPAAERADGIARLHRDAHELPAVGGVRLSQQQFRLDGDPMCHQPAPRFQPLHALGEHTVAQSAADEHRIRLGERRERVLRVGGHQLAPVSHLEAPQILAGVRQALGATLDADARGVWQRSKPFDEHAARADADVPQPLVRARAQVGERCGPGHALGDEAVVGERVVGQARNGRDSVNHRRYCDTDPSAPDLLHHGDADLGEGLEDFSVNVRAATPPTFVQQALMRAVSSWAAYPNAAPAAEAIATRWGVPQEMVLPTSGAAEAFTLVARALRPRKAVVVHPQFTEPEAALLRAGHDVSRVLLERPFTLNPGDVPDDADLVVVGNPTNPTGVLHPVEILRHLARPGRVVLVDEAFLDEVGDDHSLITAAMPGLLVTRSLTKAFSIAGVRAGYAVGDPELIARLRDEQTPWSVSSPAITLMRACMSDEALAFVRAQAAEIPAARDDLVRRLEALGLWVAPSESPFVLVDTSSIAAGSLREPLADRGFAVRRCETFPGLGPAWLRLAVRTPQAHERLVKALASFATEGDRR